MLQNTCRKTRPDSFDLVRSPLEGFNLIDASAGTGKTYTICGLVLRLLLETNLTIEQILVVTYTEAATEDLRGRIRQKIRLALDVCLSKSPVEDDFLQRYFVRIKDVGVATQRLSEAIRGFDEAAIYTIHGFCHRMLLENSFESNTLIDTELVADDSNLLKEIIEDFRRRIFSQSSDLFSKYAADRLHPELLYAFLAPFIPHAFLRFIPAIEVASGCSHLLVPETAFNKAYSAVCLAWPASRAEVFGDLSNSGALKRTTYNEASISSLMANMDGMVTAASPSPHLFDKFVLLTAGKIAATTKAGQQPNILPFYELCEELQQAGNSLLVNYERCLLALKKRLLDSFRHELDKRKERESVFSFDDLLRRLHKALTGPGGNLLAHTIARKYPAALIDEFQDTDPLQFEIFRAIHTEPGLLFLIGDPKQAIYSFRGADIFTYMDAAAASSLAHHTLGVNHRSTPTLVKAVNTIFCRAQNPFIFEAISFQPVAAAPEQVTEHLTFDGEQQEPFILWYLDRASAAEKGFTFSSHPQKPIQKSTARRLITSRVAAEIARLLALSLADRVRLGDRKLLPGDIAILVRTNDEARKMQQSLAGLQIPSVVNSGEDIFLSEEARELSILLRAVAAPNNIRFLKTALLTRFIGLQADAINLLQEGIPNHDEFIAPWLATFRIYRDLWKHYGFIRMFWAVLRENLVRQRLLGAENGERSLTNILHLAEIIQQEVVQQGLNMTGLLGYLQERLSGGRAGNREQQLRLESDGERVKIVTIHKAKGLEYPVVFCPFTWEGTRLNPREGCLFHRRRYHGRTELVYDAGSPELQQHLQHALQEEMAENLRLLYVALTRAVHRCYLVWGPISGAETSGPAYLLHQARITTAGSHSTLETLIPLLKKIADRFAGLPDHEILADLQDLAAAAEGTIRITTAQELPGDTRLAQKQETVALNARKFTGTIAHDWRISSFSSLIGGRSRTIDSNQPLQDRVLDRDELSAARVRSTGEEKNRFDIFSFPHGAKPGTFLHELLERADFTQAEPVEESIIYDKLLHFGYETSWYPVIARMLANLGKISLHREIPALRLCNILPANCRHELEFYFPLASINPAVLKHIMGASDLPGNTAKSATAMDLQLDRLIFAPARGFMRGFIDLVFASAGRYYLVDWKSNYLGASIADYGQDKLRASILEGYYFLQYHIYSLALHLFLENRLPGYNYGSDFGGVFYIYLRGVDPALGPDYGIYHDRPEQKTIETLKAKLLPGKTSRGQVL